MTKSTGQTIRNVASTAGWLAAIGCALLVLYGAFTVSRPPAPVRAQLEPLLGQLVPADFLSFSLEPSIADGKQRCRVLVDPAEAQRRHLQTLRGVAQLVGYVDLPGGLKPMYFDADNNTKGWTLRDAIIRPGQVSTAELRARISGCLSAF
jgi:hypothetical protein